MNDSAQEIDSGNVRIGASALLHRGKTMARSAFTGALAVSAFLLSAAAMTKAASVDQAPNGVPSRLLNQLDRGVNITRWFCYSDAHDTARFKGYLVDEDFQNFKNLGVHYVRLCISPEVIYKDGSANPENLAYIDAAIDKLEKAGLAVLWDLHDNGQMKLDEPGHDNAPFVKFWAEIAKHYAGKQESATVFELLNEPIFQKNPEVWYKLQKETVAAIRVVDPKRTILVASTGWNGIDTLLAMQPLEEKNLVYSFHCYDPFTFTHQGASWTGEQQKALRDVPFPSSPDAVNAMIDKIPDPYKGAVRDYGEKRYGAQYLFDRLSSCSQWGARNRVPVLLGEFGAFPPVSPVDSRARWFDAMAAAISSLKLPNAVWGYDDALGLGRSVQDGKVSLDSNVLTHLYGK